MDRMRAKAVSVALLALVTLSLPACDRKTAAPVPYAGRWVGTWADKNEKGTLDVRVERDGRISGTVRNESYGGDGRVSGRVDTKGNANLEYSYGGRDPANTSLFGLGYGFSVAHLSLCGVLLVLLLVSHFRRRSTGDEETPGRPAGRLVSACKIVGATVAVSGMIVGLATFGLFPSILYLLGMAISGEGGGQALSEAILLTLISLASVATAIVTIYAVISYFGRPVAGRVVLMGCAIAWIVLTAPLLAGIPLKSGRYAAEGAVIMETKNGRSHLTGNLIESRGGEPFDTAQIDLERR